MHSHSCLPIPDHGMESASNRRSPEGFPYYNSKAIGNRSRTTQEKAGTPRRFFEQYKLLVRETRTKQGETFRFKTADSFDRGETRSPRIVRGMYGGSGSYIDVTDALRDYAKRGESFRVSPEAFGLDPERTQGSHLRMTVIDRSGEREQREYEDGDYVDFR